MASKKSFPEDSSGLVYGPDGRPVRRTRAHVLGGFSDTVESRQESGLLRDEVGAGGINYNSDRQADEFLG